ncbi:sigma-70 family RNA polymerase sigma factor [Streptomyces angustmyceticus]|uniref:sigma-70 family RNA polymerase sigma factor n=1 Tax=Streptomyces angustmyceticus TaxID=285578 RepID=UPI0037D9A4AA
MVTAVPPTTRPPSRPDHHTKGVRQSGTSSPALALAEDIQALKPHLAELGDRDRTLLELRFGAEMPQSEIGEELGLSQMHVSRLITRICTHLREEMLATD